MCVTLEEDCKCINTQVNEDLIKNLSSSKMRKGVALRFYKPVNIKVRYVLPPGFWRTLYSVAGSRCRLPFENSLLLLVFLMSNRQSQIVALGKKICKTSHPSPTIRLSMQVKSRPAFICWTNSDRNRSPGYAARKAIRLLTDTLSTKTTFTTV